MCSSICPSRSLSRPSHCSCTGFGAWHGCHCPLWHVCFPIHGEVECLQGRVPDEHTTGFSGVVLGPESFVSIGCSVGYSIELSPFCMGPGEHRIHTHANTINQKMCVLRMHPCTSSTIYLLLNKTFMLTKSLKLSNFPYKVARG